jgi:dephospho-CoA kinase
MELWGITGIIGSGKSTAVSYLASEGYACIDADSVSRLVVDKNTEVGRAGFEQIYRAFGNSVLDNLGNLDRRALRLRMMRNPDDRKKLEEILHPLILDYIDKWARKQRELGAKLVFVEGSRLVESRFHEKLNGLLVVTAEEKKIIPRVVKRDSMGKEEVQMMISLQDEKAMLQHAKFEVKNNGSKDELHKKLDRFLEGRIR